MKENMDIDHLYKKKVGKLNNFANRGFSQFIYT